MVLHLSGKKISLHVGVIFEISRYFMKYHEVFSNPSPPPPFGNILHFAPLDKADR